MSDFERLLDIVGADLEFLAETDRPARWRQAPVSFELEFGFADVRAAVPAATGTASATLDAVCQRCLEPFSLPLAVSLRYVLLAAGEQTDGFEDYEAWEMTEDRLRPLDLVEEALIMALPLSAVHGTVGECGPLARRSGASGKGAGDTVRPFAGLKAQLEDTK